MWNTAKINISTHISSKQLEVKNSNFYTMKQKESCGDKEKYKAPQVDLFQLPGQSILVYLSASLPDEIEEGDEDTFLPVQ